MSPFDLKINSGEMRQSVTLQTLTVTQDALGQDQKTWASQGPYWCQVKPLGGRELVKAQQVKAEVSHAIMLRWNPDIAVDPTARLVFGSRYFNIGAVLNVEERGIKMTILATEQVVPTNT